MKNTKISNILCVALSAIIIFSFGIAIYAAPKKSFSERENRTLADFPRLSLESITDGIFFSNLSEFYTDQFPMRNIFTAIKAKSERILLKCENNGVIFCQNGALVTKGELDVDTLKKNLAYIRALAKETNAKTCIVPRAIDVRENELPKIYDTSIEKRRYYGKSITVYERKHSL